VWSLFFQKVVDSEKVMHGLKKSKRLDQAAKDKIETICIFILSLRNQHDSWTRNRPINHGRFFRICQPFWGADGSDGDGDLELSRKIKTLLVLIFHRYHDQNKSLKIGRYLDK
jgi:hypothetical protein